MTLIETMVGISVMMIGVLGALVSQVASANLLRTSKETNRAVLDLRAVMDQVLVMPAGTIPVAGSVYADNAVITAYNGLHLKDEQITVDYPGYVAGGAVPNPLTIVLTINWTDYAGRARTLTLSSMKTQ